MWRIRFIDYICVLLYWCIKTLFKFFHLYHLSKGPSKKTSKQDIPDHFSFSHHKNLKSKNTFTSSLKCHNVTCFKQVVSKQKKNKTKSQFINLQFNPTGKWSLLPLTLPRTWILGTVAQWTGSGAGGWDEPGCWRCGKRPESLHAGPERRQSVGP